MAFTDTLRLQFGRIFKKKTKGDDHSRGGEGAEASDERLASELESGQRSSIHTSLKYITLVRGVYALLVLSYCIVWFVRSSMTQLDREAMLLLGCVSEILVFTTVCCFCLLRNKFVKVLTYVGMLHDSLLVAFIVILTGGASSPFYYLFLIVPLYGGLSLQRKGGIIGAFIVSAVLLGAFYLSPVPMSEILDIPMLHDGDILRRSFLTYLILAAFCVGVLTGQLSYMYASVSHSLAEADSAFAHLKGIYAILLNALPIGVVIVNPNTNRVLFFNPSARRLLGDSLDIPKPMPSSQELPHLERAFRYEGEEGKEDVSKNSGLSRSASPGDSGLGIKNTSTPEYHAFREMRKIQKMAKFTQESLNEWTSLLKDKYLHIAQFSLPVNNNQFLGYHIMDLTAQYKAQTERAQRARLEHLGEFSAKVAHEIRNPLSCISGCNEMLQFVTDEAEEKQIHEMMNGEITRLNNMLNDILVFSRKPKLRIQPLSLREVIQSQWERFKEGKAHENMRLEHSIASELEIIFDETSLRQIIMTLWQNAAEATQGNAIISVRADCAAFIAFFDSGNGISDGDSERVFEPFYTTKPTGTGLGLATARQYARDNGYELFWDKEKRCFALKQLDFGNA